MESARPIEPGCRAIFIKGKFTGEEVTVGKFIGTHENLLKYGNTLWEIDKAIPTTCDGTTQPGPEFYMAPEYVLMRIDDPGLQKQIEREQELVNET